jgi:hypothetical protein
VLGSLQHSSSFVFYLMLACGYGQSFDAVISGQNSSITFRLSRFKMKRFTTLIIGVLIAHTFVSSVRAVVTNSYVSFREVAGGFVLSDGGQSVPIVISSDDFSGVQRVAKDLQQDIERVTDAKPELLTQLPQDAKTVVVVGTIGKSPLIDELIANGQLDATGVTGCWEASVTECIENPWPGIERALVIAGSDKRGTIFGMYELSRQIGVSPWYWWADVPPRKVNALYVLPGRHVDQPKVKYRGIFINDEEPALGGWAREKFGGVNSKMYAHMFELILRLKGNYLWPAMWGKSIYDDDPESPRLADEYGVVIGTSHHEPMMRAHVEWERYGEGGAWNYKTNAEKLREFWREGIKRMGDNESIVTLAMRGDGDEPMSAEADIALLETIVADQRKILEAELDKPLESQPQVWALYKEVQEYYDKGMRVPDDVTLLLCDDNWGNLRKLPNLKDNPRAGGYGIYYHFDYVGGPRNYKWLNTTQVARVWEQMHLAYRHGVDRLWVVNVGDLKPMEYPIEFFLDYAWDPEAWPAERLPEYARAWAEEQFGPEHAERIAAWITGYTTINSRRKPELLSPETYSLVNYHEWDYVNSYLGAQTFKAQMLFAKLPAEQRDAFFQLVLFPIQATANLNELYYTVARNRLYAEQGRASTNELAEQARKLYARDADLCRQYNEDLADGKWRHMMDQAHIGYTYWQQPDKQAMPVVKEIEIGDTAKLGVAIEGSTAAWPGSDEQAVLPELTPWSRQSVWTEVFNRGTQPFEYQITASEPWVQIERSQGAIGRQETVGISIDWNKVPLGRHLVELTISGADEKVTIELPVNKPSAEGVHGFVESNGYVSMNAEHFIRAVNTDDIHWERIPNLGRSASGSMSAFPVTVEPRIPEGDAPRLEYKVHLFNSGKVKVKAYLAPTLDFPNKRGLECAISFDDEQPQIVNLHPDTSVPAWEAMVAINANIVTSEHEISEPGEHTLKFWMVDPGVVVERLVIETGNVRPSYLGPPESRFVP